MTWTPAMKARAIELWAQGVTADAISRDPLIDPAKKSRSAVIGFLHRHQGKSGAKGRSNAQQRQDTRQKLKAPRRQKPRVKPAPKSLARSQPALSRRDLPAAAPSRSIDMMDLTPAHCRYPTSGEGVSIKFCGHPRDRSQDKPLDVYCPAHAALCRRAK